MRFLPDYLAVYQNKQTPRLLSLTHREALQLFDSKLLRPDDPATSSLAGVRVDCVSRAPRFVTCTISFHRHDVGQEDEISDESPAKNSIAESQVAEPEHQADKIC